MEPQSPSIDPDELLAELVWVRELARALVRDPATADDLVQDTWLAATTRPPREIGSAGLRGWLATVVRNLARREARSSARRLRREQAAAQPERQPDGVIARATLQSELAQAVLELEEPLRSAVLLRYLDGLTAPQIAQRQGISHEAARKRLSRGLAVLRERLDRRHGGDRERWFLALNAWLDASADGALVAPASKVALTGALLVIAKVGAALAAAVALWIVGALLTSPDGDSAPGALDELAARAPVAPARTSEATAGSPERGEPGPAALASTWKLIDERGQPLAGWTVLALERGAWRATSPSATDGTVTFGERVPLDALLAARIGTRPVMFGSPFDAPGSLLVVPSGARVAGRVELRARDGVVRLVLEDDAEDRDLSRLDSRALAALELLGIEPRRRTLVLDEDGHFRFEGLPADWSGALELAGGWSFESAAPPAAIEPPQHALLLGPATDLELAASPPLRVHGRVVSQGRPEGLEGVQVTAQRAGLSAGLVHVARTGPGGDFTLEIPRRGLQREPWAALLRLEYCGVTHRRPVQIERERLESERELGTFELEIRRRIGVRVRDAQGRAVAGARVRVPDVASGTTDAHGWIELAVDPDGLSSVHVSADGHRPEVVSMPALGELEVMLQPSNRLEVRVVDDSGAPWRHGRMRLASAEHPFATRAGPGGAFETELELDAKGAFTLSDLLPGVELEFSCDGADPMRARAPAAGASLSIELVRARTAVTFEGRVVDLAGRPLPRCRVSASGIDSLEVVTDAQGRFEARLDATWPAIDVLEVSRPGFARTQLTDVRLPAEGLLQVVLEPGRDLEVIVLDAQGAPLDVPLLRATVEDGREFSAEPLGAGRHRFFDLPERSGAIAADLCGVDSTQPFGPAESLVTMRLPPMGELELQLAAESVDASALTCVVIRPAAGSAPARRFYFHREDDQLAPLRLPVAAGRYSLSIERRRLGSSARPEVLAIPRDVEVAAGRRVSLVLP